MRGILAESNMEAVLKTNNTWRIESKKPAGGYVFIKAEHLLRAWSAYQQGQIDLYAFRVWLACHELVARRCQISKNIKACYRIEELQALTGTGTVPRHRKAIRSLEKAGLLKWLGDDINLEIQSIEHDIYFQSMLNKVQNHRRKIPVSRRIIKNLASQRRKVLIATVLGHLLRCLYYRNNACLSGGRCKASWIADVFNVDIRNVKAARKELIEQNWLSVVASSQLALNRWGLAVTINLEHDFEVDKLSSKTPPPKQLSTIKSPPPISNIKLSMRVNNHKLASRRTNGTQMSKKRKIPNLRNIVLDDLKQAKRLDSLFWEAVSAGIVRQSQAQRLQWFAAAERAIASGTQNPCGFFATMVKRHLWHHITHEQEDIARIKLKNYDFGDDYSHASVITLI